MFIIYVFSKYYLDRLGVRSFVIAIDIWNEVCTAQARGSSDSTAQRSCVNGTDFPLECGAVRTKCNSATQSNGVDNLP